MKEDRGKEEEERKLGIYESTTRFKHRTLQVIKME